MKEDEKPAAAPLMPSVSWAEMEKRMLEGWKKEFGPGKDSKPQVPEKDEGNEVDPNDAA